MCFPKTDILRIIEVKENTTPPEKLEIKNIDPNNNNIANSYAEKADKFYRDNKLDDAIEMLLKAMEYNPGDTLFPKNAGIMYYNNGNFVKAGELFSRVLEIDNKDIFAHEYLGRSYYYSNLLKKALTELNTAVDLDPGNSSLLKFKEKVENETRIENSFQKTSQEIFVIQYDYQTEFRFTSIILNTLLEAYWRIIRDLSYYSKKEFKIPVIIYTKKAFKDIEHPEWAGAIYDGKIRIPVENLNEQKDKELKDFIYHELTHAILYYYCNGRTLPVWLNEGIAQLEEINQRDIHAVKKLLKGKQLLHLKDREKSFSDLTDPKIVEIAYLQSYLAVNFILERYSKQALLDILKKLSENKSIEDAILTTLFIDYDQFEERCREYILR
ncbi:MAG: peptidase MA family metallohydrolase [bacterium]|nr:peptidase MA family metallohydrolase [bacterium]